MRVLIINEVCGYTSTGKICAQIAENYEEEGHTVKIAYGRSPYVPDEYKRYAVRIGKDWDVNFHAVMTRINDTHGFQSKLGTNRFLRWVEQYKPDLIWLHNLHGYYINVEYLFKWIKSHQNIEIRWTLHDCWAMTGHCVYFSAINCDKWKFGCYDCPQLMKYPATRGGDHTRRNYEWKKKTFSGVKNMTLITPSEWLKKIVEDSFMGEYKIEVQPNKIDTHIFKATESNFRKKYNIEDKKIILGVANVWTTNKGFNTFLKLPKLLGDGYAVVMVGLNKRQLRVLPDSIIGIERTHDQAELAGIYSAADIYFNPSLEETFGMTTLEAISCGTYTVVYKDTACEEVVKNYQNMGTAIEPGNLRTLIKIVEKKTKD